MRPLLRRAGKVFMVVSSAALLLGVAADVAYRTAPTGTLEPGPADVLVIFGSPTERNGTLLPMQRWRVDEAVAEYRRGIAPYLLFVGGTAANRYVESETMALEARRQGVPVGAVLTETRSVTTVENLRNIAPILQAHGWTRVEMISSVDHLPRIAVLLEKAPYQWRLHAAPTPGRSRLGRVDAFLEESLVILVLRVFGSSAEPVIHAIARTVNWIAFAVRFVTYRIDDLLHRR